jgi:hypothetical protein
MKRVLRSVRLAPRCSARTLFSFALLVCLVVLAQPFHAQTIAPTANPQETSMQHYVLLFRTTRTLTPEEQKARPADIAAWIQQVTGMGIKLDPRSLGETAAAISSSGNQAVAHPGSFDPTLSNIVFFDATKAQANEVERLHPAPRYGVTVELREWSSPAPIQPRP